MIEIRVSIDEAATGVPAEILGLLTGPEMTALNQRGARAARNAAQTFHQEFDNRGGWRRTGGGPSQFGKDTAIAWKIATADKDGATISNEADHYAHKVRGGTIRPKRVSALTIPLVPEAKGLRARDFEIQFRTKLFRIKGKNALFARTEERVTAERGRGRRSAGASTVRKSSVRAIYALLKSVTQAPWPDAVPPGDLLGDAFLLEWRRAMIEQLDDP
jgi:hypothetical protein